MTDKPSLRFKFQADPTKISSLQLNKNLTALASKLGFDYCWLADDLEDNGEKVMTSTPQAEADSCDFIDLQARHENFYKGLTVTGLKNWDDFIAFKSIRRLCAANGVSASLDGGDYISISPIPEEPPRPVEEVAHGSGYLRSLDLVTGPEFENCKVDGGIYQNKSVVKAQWPPELQRIFQDEIFTNSIKLVLISKGDNFDHVTTSLSLDSSLHLLAKALFATLKTLQSHGINPADILDGEEEDVSLIQDLLGHIEAN